MRTKITHSVREADKNRTETNGKLELRITFAALQGLAVIGNPAVRRIHTEDGENTNKKQK